MRSSRPPALATWLVEHLILGAKSEALAGDLSEQFSRGRSAAWYWRQVLVAIFLGLSKELRILWLAVSFTTVWAFIVTGSIQRLIYFTRLFQVVFGWGVTLRWPISMIALMTFIAALYAVPLLVSLTTYLAISKNFQARRLLQGLLTGWVGLVLSYIGAMLLPIHVLGHTPAGHVGLSLPLFFALLLSMWMVRPNNAARTTAKIPI